MTGIGFRAAVPEDAALILEWRNDAESRQQSFDGNWIDPDTHMAWFARKLNDPACFFYVLTVDGEPAGQIRIDVRDAIGEISYTVAPAHRGCGIGTALITNAVQVCSGRVRALVGIVKSDNRASCRCFEKNGFTGFEAEDRRFYLKLLQLEEDQQQN